jgi:sugar lactone lactonase YvrE
LVWWSSVLRAGEQEAIVRRLAIFAVVILLLLTVPAAAAPASTVIVLPGATSAEGIATGRGATFYAGDLLAGDIFTGDLQTGDVALLRDAPEGRLAVGMAVDRDLLFVAGGFTGQGYVYDARTGADVAVLQLADPAAGTFVNDVTIARREAWFTDSVRPTLYRVPFGSDGAVGASTALTLQGPAAALTGDFNLNGIAATPNGKTLIVSHSANGALYGVDPSTGDSWLIEGVSVPNVDGILLESGRLWAVQNFSNQVSVVRLDSDLRSGTVTDVITSPDFQVPATVARHGSRIAVVNAKFDTGFPPTAEEYEVVVVRGK